MTDTDHLQALGEAHRELGRLVVAETGVAGTLQALVTVAARCVPGVDIASITGRRGDKFVTEASSDEAATQADMLQYQVGHGPCVDAVRKDNVFHSHDLAVDQRWPTFGPAAASSVGVRSVLSIRLFMEDEFAIAGLNLYAYQRNAFDDRSQDVGMLLATHASAVLTAQIARDTAVNLRRALVNSRGIGTAMGVLMATYKITREDAFDVLRLASQRSNRKLRDIAEEVTETGTLDV